MSILSQMLTREEGRRNKAYKDSLGIWTIGIGHTGPEVHENLVWTDAQIDTAFSHDIADAVHSCFKNFSPWFVGLNESRQAVLISMVFQLGLAGTLKFKHMLFSLAQNDFQGAADAMLDSLWAKQTPARVKRATETLITGTYHGF